MLTGDSWERLQALFHAAVDRPRSEWRPFLDAAADGDAALVDRVIGMLNADARETSVLDRDSVDLAADLLDVSSSAIGRRIGPYRITRLLGEGGMGVVYLAERADLGTQAAVKVLRDAWVSPSRRERFAAEQRTLAHLNHPAIARMYDAGTLDDGTPWIVMEHVEGVPLTEACRARGLRLRERLQLFRTVCEAVVHAHQHLVVHRDVKPSNILVRADGTVKLLDFGIAKQLEQVNETDRTQTGLRMMTPAYAAPEQVRGEAVGVCTDVYALGVVLYELLAGRLPHQLATKTPGAIERAILEVEPERVSVAARQEGSGIAASGAAWDDLDVLCATAMHKEPSRRYASVDALIRDLDHFLAGEPLDAQPDSFRYRAARFVIRNRRLVAATAAVILVIAALNVFYAIRLTRARDQAVAEAARTGRIQRFVTQLFQGGDQAAGPAESLHVLTLVDRGVQDALSLTSEPAIQAELFQTLGGIFQKLGKLDRADTLLRAALERRVALSGDSSADVASSLVALGGLRTDQAQFAAAESLARSGLAITSASLPPGHPRLAEATEVLGRVLSEKGDYKAAVPVLEEAVRLRSIGSNGQESAEYASSVYELANANFYAGNLDVSDSLNRLVLAVHRRIYGDRHPSVSDDLINLGAGQFERANYPEAERFYREALAITVAHYGRDHFKTASNLTMVGRSLLLQKKFDEAVEVLNQALTVRERVYGPVHPAVASTVNELGSVALQRNLYPEAEAAYRRMIDIYAQVYKDKHYLIGIAQSNLASVRMARGDNKGAEQLFRQAIAMYNQTLQPTHTNTGIARIKLGRSLLRQGRFVEAERESRAGYEILAPQLNPTVSWLVSARSDLAKAYEALKRPEDAARVRAESTSVAQAAKK